MSPATAWDGPLIPCSVSKAISKHTADCSTTNCSDINCSVNRIAHYTADCTVDCDYTADRSNSNCAIADCSTNCSTIHRSTSR